MRTRRSKATVSRSPFTLRTCWRAALAVAAATILWVGQSSAAAAREGVGSSRGAAVASEGVGPSRSAAAATVGGGPSRATAASSPWAGAGIVRAPGGPYLVDSLGRRLQLHGIDLVAKCGGGALPTAAAGSPCVGPPAGPHLAYVLSPTARDAGRRFTAADARTLARLGFTVVRLGIIWEGLEPGLRGVGANDRRYCARHAKRTPFPALGAADPYRASAVNAYLARTDRIVRLLAGAGMRVIIDMHQDAYGSSFSQRAGPTPWNGEGAPAWATCTDRRRFDGLPSWGQAYGDPVVNTAIGHFWHNDVRGDLQGQFARVWQAVARHYRGDAEVLGYEVLNEPTDFAIPDFNRQLQCAYAGPVRAPRSCAGGRVQALDNGLIGAIQAADETHLVLFEPLVTSFLGQPETVGITEPLRFPRLVLAFHIYGVPPAGVRGCAGTACLNFEQAALDSIVAARARTRTRQPGGPAMIMDEFGGGPRIADIAQVAGLARQSSVSWSEWSALQLHDPTGVPGEGLLAQRTRQPWAAKAQALTAPYPVATAGTPGPQTYDPVTASFSYSYAVDRRVHAPTEIVVAPDLYPHGYVAAARGARILSRPGARLLMVDPLPGRRAITVTVTRSRRERRRAPPSPGAPAQPTNVARRIDSHRTQEAP